MKKRLKKIIVILCIISLLNNYSVVLAVDVATAGNALASYAYNFYKKGEDGSGAARTKYVCEAGVVNLTTLGTAARAKKGTKAHKTKAFKPYTYIKTLRKTLKINPRGSFFIKYQR